MFNQWPGRMHEPCIGKRTENMRIKWILNNKVDDAVIPRARLTGKQGSFNQTASFCAKVELQSSTPAPAGEQHSTVQAAQALLCCQPRVCSGPGEALGKTFSSGSQCSSGTGPHGGWAVPILGGFETWLKKSRPIWSSIGDRDAPASPKSVTGIYRMGTAKATETSPCTRSSPWAPGTAMSSWGSWWREKRRELTSAGNASNTSLQTLPLSACLKCCWGESKKKARKLIWWRDKMAYQKQKNSLICLTSQSRDKEVTGWNSINTSTLWKGRVLQGHSNTQEGKANQERTGEVCVRANSR